jgi:hypothetical protein
MNEPTPDNIVAFPASTAKVLVSELQDPQSFTAQPAPAEAPDTAGGEPAGESPWKGIADALALELWAMAHGVATIEHADAEGRARVAEMSRRLEAQLLPGIQAAMGWAGGTLYLHQVQSALQHVVLRAEVHAPSKGRHNERVLVYADRLEALAALMQKMPKRHEEAAAWWKDREDALEQLAELPRIVAMVEKEMGGAPDVAKDHTTVEKVEGMFIGLLGVLAQQKEFIERQKGIMARQAEALKDKLRR